MNGGLLPLLLLCGTIGLMLSFTAARTGWLAIAGMTMSAVILSLGAWPQSLATVIFAGLWATVIAAAAMTYLPPRLAERLAVPLAVLAGVGAGTLASSSGRKSDLLFALPLSLAFVPGRWIVAKGHGLGIKIVASWMIAIALLSTFVSMTSTPGYQPDHME